MIALTVLKLCSVAIEEGLCHYFSYSNTCFLKLFDTAQKYKSSLCIREAAQLRTVAAGVSLCVVARCGTRRPAMATNTGRWRKSEYT